MTPDAANPDLAKLREELETSTRKLAEAHKLASLGRLSAGIVHEINSPIGSIFSNNEVILRSLARLKKILTEQPETATPIPQKALDLVDNIASLSEVDRIACERIAGIIRSLKTFARVNENDIQKVNLNDLLRNTVKLTSATFRRRVAFECEFGDFQDVECYPGLLYQVFLNLIVNAAQAIEDEGTVTIRTRLDGCFAEIEISDDGCGIPPEVQRRIFTAGFTTKPLGEGTGLGLTITREIVEDTHGGKISFETELGRGTTFQVRIPLEQPRSDITRRNST